MAAPTRKKIFEVSGESKNARDGTPRQQLLTLANPGDRIVLERQPDNPYDPNAIAVVWQGSDVGFLPKEDAAALAPHLDEGRPYKAQIHELKGGVKNYPSYGVRISIAWDGGDLPPFRPLDDNQERSRRGKLSAMKRKRDADGAFVGSGSKGEPKSGCLGVLVAVVLVGVAGLQAFT